MIDNTINDTKMFVGGGKGVVLVGHYHIVRQLWYGGMGARVLAHRRLPEDGIM